MQNVKPRSIRIPIPEIFPRRAFVHGASCYHQSSLNYVSPSLSVFLSRTHGYSLADIGSDVYVAVYCYSSCFFDFLIRCDEYVLTLQVTTPSRVIVLRVSAAAVARSDQRFLYVYRFGNSCDEQPASCCKFPPSSSSLNHLHSPDNPTSTSVTAARYPQGSDSTRRPGACGGSAVLGIYIVASLANCFSFLFTVLFGVVSLTVTDDLRRIADVIDELQVCIYGLFFVSLCYQCHFIHTNKNQQLS